MLVLSRKTGDCIEIGTEVKIYIIQIKGEKIRLGIEAKPHLKISKQTSKTKKPKNKPKIHQKAQKNRLTRPQRGKSDHPSP